MSMFARSDKTSDGSVAVGKAADGGPARGDEQRSGQRTGEPRPAPVPSVIGTGLKVKGDLESAGEIQVDGEVEGDVRGKIVMIGEGAVVKGSIFGDSVTVSGTIEGKVEAMTVTVQSTARLTGDIIHETVKIDQGAYVDGRCSPQFGKAAARAAGPAAIVPPPKAGEAEKADKAEGAGKPH